MRLLFLSLFMLVAMVVVFGSHYLLYVSLVKFFALSGAIKVYLAVGLALLSISFIVASILVHYFDNVFSKTIYFLAGLWLGLLTYLFIGVLLVWLLILVKNLIGFNLNIKLIASCLVALAFLVTVYGCWNATQIKIKKLVIPIRNLPANWQNKKLVQISDVHLGSVLGVAFITKLVEQINQQSPEAVLITGDYFDGMDGILDNLVAPLNKLNAPKGTYFITGNHENYLGLNKALGALNAAKVKVLDDQAVNLDGLGLIGLSYPPEGTNKDVVAIIEKLKPAEPTILLYHAPAQVEKIAKTGIDLMLSGHTHQGQLWPFGYIAKIIFGKYYTGFNTLGDFTEYTSVGVGTWGPAMRVGNQPEIVVITLVKK